MFNPALPATPFARAARRNESFFSANGSPIAPPFVPSETLEDADEANLSDEGDSDDSDELPDPDALEAKLLARAAASPKSKPSQPSQASTSSRASSQPSSSSHPSRKAKAKRAPSLMFRKSLAPGTEIPPVEENGKALTSIPLSDGRSVTFDPFQLSPRRIEEEIEEGGLSKEEKERVRLRIKEEAVKALTAQMDRWDMFDK